MRSVCEDILLEEGISEYAVLPLSACRVLRPELFSRGGDFTPQSVLVFLVPYYTGPAENLSLYAVSRDYHRYMQTLSERLLSALAARYPTAAYRAFADHSPIDERHAASVAGLGMLGDNGLLINQKYASLVFIGEIFSDLPAPADTPIHPVTVCEHCGACRRACPTGALTLEGECLSELTQRKGELAPSTVALMRRHSTLWGCDLCQTACPHTRRVIEESILTPIAYFHEGRIPYLDARTLDGMDTAAFRERAFSWRGRATIARNVAAFFGEEK